MPAPLTPDDVAVMARGPLTVGNACQLCEAGYRREHMLDVVERLSVNRVHALIVRAGAPGAPGVRVLVIKGTVDRSQWRLFNLRFWPQTEQGDTRRWHRGFLSYAQAVHAFAKGKGVEVVTGHSLGAAAAQIVGPSLGVPTIAFASPRPLYDGQHAGAGLVLNVCRRDDEVCDLPWWGFEHVGPVVWFRPDRRRLGEDHRTPHYLRALDGTEPGVWEREPAEDARGPLGDTGEG